MQEGLQRLTFSLNCCFLSALSAVLTASRSAVHGKQAKLMSHEIYKYILITSAHGISQD